MANEQPTLRPWFLDLVPLIVVLLIAAHVFALVLSILSLFCLDFIKTLSFNSVYFHFLLGLLDLQISHRETASAKKSTLKLVLTFKSLIRSSIE